MSLAESNPGFPSNVVSAAERFALRVVEPLAEPPATYELAVMAERDAAYDRLPGDTAAAAIYLAAQAELHDRDPEAYSPAYLSPLETHVLTSRSPRTEMPSYRNNRFDTDGNRVSGNE